MRNIDSDPFGLTPQTGSQRPKQQKKQRMPVPTLQPSIPPTQAPTNADNRGPFVPRLGAKIEVPKRSIGKKRLQAQKNPKEGPYVPRLLPPDQSGPSDSSQEHNTQPGTLEVKATKNGSSDL